jgi:hypothetical protein
MSFISRKEIVMKKMAFGFALTLAALGLMASPAMAEPGARQSAPILSDADQAFLAALALPDPTPAAKRPIQGKVTCTASCGIDHPLTCPSGTTTCSAVDRSCPDQRGYVICDGVKTRCPVCPMDCDSLLADCAAQCGRCPISSFQCNPYVCNCVLCPG